MITNDTLVQVGFKPPSMKFTKVDPRGAEYGMFTAEIVDAEEPFKFSLPALIATKLIEVRKLFSDGSLDYLMCFTSATHFQRWAKDVL